MFRSIFGTTPDHSIKSCPALQQQAFSWASRLTTCSSERVAKHFETNSSTARGRETLARSGRRRQFLDSLHLEVHRVSSGVYSSDRIQRRRLYDWLYVMACTFSLESLRAGKLLLVEPQHSPRSKRRYRAHGAESFAAARIATYGGIRALSVVDGTPIRLGT